MQMVFRKGEPRPANAGRRKGTPNKRTVYVREVLEGAAHSIGGRKRLIAWIRERPENEYAFWTSMYMRLLPMHVQGSGPHGALEMTVKFTREELAKRLEERGLPPTIFGIDVPTLELEAEHGGNGKIRN
jgi:hypothetical protein